MSKTDPDYGLVPAFNWLDDGTSRFMSWCYEHWRFTVSAIAGVPVLAGIAIGLLIGWVIF